MDTFLESCEKPYDDNVILVSKTFDINDITQITINAPPENMDTISEKFSGWLKYYHYSFPRNANTHIKMYKNILCIKCVAKSLDSNVRDVVYFIEDFETFHYICTKKNIDNIWDFFVNPEYSSASIIGERNWWYMCIKSTNIELLKYDVSNLRINTNIVDYPDVKIRYIHINTDNLSESLNTVNCKYIQIYTKPTTVKNLSIIAENKYIYFSDLNTIDPIIAWWQLNKKYINIHYYNFEKKITLPAFESVYIKYNSGKNKINLSNGTTIFKTNDDYTNDIPPSVKGMEILTNYNSDIPHYVDTLTITSFRYDREKLHPYVKNLQLQYSLDCYRDVKTEEEYIGKYFPKLETLYVMEKGEYIKIR